jgi:PAS domain S-box-containing protein
MNDTAAVLTENVGASREKLPATRTAILAIALVLVPSIAAFIWLYGQRQMLPGGVSSAGAESQAAAFARLVVGLVIVSAFGGAIYLVKVLSGLMVSRRAGDQNWQTKEEEWNKNVTRLKLELKESRRNEEQMQMGQIEVQERVTRITKENTQLRGELDQLKRAEKALAQQRQVLESSKAVLELHVQERTKELQKLQRRYEMILNSAGEGICGLDTDGKTIFVNPAVARITGWPLAELIGKTEQEIFGLNEAMPSAPANNTRPGERVFLRKDSTSFPVEFIKTSINENEKVVGSVLVFKDISERRSIEDNITQKAAELARSNSELEQFAFVASHDLQEPLRKIQAFGDRLRAKCENTVSTEAMDYLERMQNAAGRMRTLIDDLLAFSRVFRSSEPFVPVDLGAVTREVLGDLEVRVEKTGAQIEIGQLPTIEADPMQMRQLMLNLLSNALKFQVPGSKPVINVQSRIFSTQAGEQTVEMTVQDNGIGFEEKYMDKVFAVFQRLHGRNEYEGTGVGLAVCRRITDRHHGTITAKSQLGQGATFIVTMPVRRPPAKPNV